MRVRTCLTPSPKPNFVEIFKGVYPFLANLYDKLPILTISGALSPHFISHNGEIKASWRTLDHCIVFPEFQQLVSDSCWWKMKICYEFYLGFPVSRDLFCSSFLTAGPASCALAFDDFIIVCHSNCVQDTLLAFSQPCDSIFQQLQVDGTCVLLSYASHLWTLVTAAFLSLVQLTLSAYPLFPNAAVKALETFEWVISVVVVVMKMNGSECKIVAAFVIEHNQPTTRLYAGWQLM